jgi:hypothetical protein
VGGGDLDELDRHDDEGEDYVAVEGSSPVLREMAGVIHYLRNLNQQPLIVNDSVLTLLTSARIACRFPKELDHDRRGRER